MVYKKITLTSIIVAIFAAVISSFVFGAAEVATNDKIYDTVMEVLIFVQKYSWPIITIIFIFALYKFYIAGSEYIEEKVLGQNLIVGISIFMAIIQALPLIYAFFIVS